MILEGPKPAPYRLVKNETVLFMFNGQSFIGFINFDAQLYPKFPVSRTYILPLGLPPPLKHQPPVYGELTYQLPFFDELSLLNNNDI